MMLGFTRLGSELCPRRWIDNLYVRTCTTTYYVLEEDEFHHHEDLPYSLQRGVDRERRMVRAEFEKGGSGGNSWKHDGILYRGRRYMILLFTILIIHGDDWCIGSTTRF